MGRPVKFDRDQAIELAMNEIWRSGYEACSVKALSEKLGITRSSFYNAFGSREALFREALARYAGQAPDSALAQLPEGVTVKGLVTRTFREICRLRATDPQGRGCMAVNAVAELCNSHDELGPAMTEAVLGGVARLEALLGRGLERGEFAPATDIRALALALQNLLIGLNVMGKAVREEGELWRAAKTTLKGLGMYEA